MKLLLTGVIVAASITSTVTADLVNPDVPSWRGADNTAYYGWNSFENAVGQPNMNEIGAPGAMLFNFAEGAMVTGAGNIYNPTGGLDIHVYGYSNIEHAVLNFSSQGNEFNYSQVALAVTFASGGQGYYFADSYEIEDYVEIPNFGANVTSSYQWDLSSIDQEIIEWGFFMTADAPHTSLDAVSVDIAMGAIPAPGALVLLGLAGCSIRHRRTA